MEQLNKKQLAFLLDIKVEDARARMCIAWAKHKEIKNDAEWGTKQVGNEIKFTGKVDSDFPDFMPIEVLSKHLNLPHLQQAVDDISNNYLKRQATKRYILFEYPEKVIKKIQESGENKKLTIPSTLASMLPESVIQEIKAAWADHYPKYV